MEGVLYQEAFGYADLETSMPYTLETVQSVASVSKTTIAFAVLKLKEEGKLSLDMPIANFLLCPIANPHFKDSILRIKHLVQKSVA